MGRPIHGGQFRAKSPRKQTGPGRRPRFFEGEPARAVGEFANFHDPILYAGGAEALPTPAEPDAMAARKKTPRRKQAEPRSRGHRYFSHTGSLTK